MALTAAIWYLHAGVQSELLIVNMPANILKGIQFSCSSCIPKRFVNRQLYCTVLLAKGKGVLGKVGVLRLHFATTLLALFLFFPYNFLC